MNGNQGSPQHNEQGSQMAATGTREEQEAANNHDKQVRIHIAWLSAKFLKCLWNEN